VALELAERGIRVNAICPGRIATAIFSGIIPDMPADIVDRSPEIAEPWLAEGVFRQCCNFAGVSHLRADRSGGMPRQLLQSKAFNCA